MNTDYDVIVVGARCAGSPTAMLLARRGYRVLLLDRASVPSDSVSTLIIHSPGIDSLRRWGVLDELAATGCPPVQRYIFDFGPVVIDGTPYPWHGTSIAYAPRRKVLDKILVDAAARAGADVREGFTVDEVLIEDGAVVGVRGHGSGGPSVVERARVVVGADGWNSRVARAVGAQAYHDKPVLERAYYTYWSGLPVDGFTTYIRGDRGIAAIPTNDELTLVLVGVPIGQANDFKRDLETNYLAAVDREPEFAKKVRAATREDRFVGEGVPNFFRTPFGPGWALIGDAGYTKDPITAQGITDAFHSAERCAEALDAAFTGRRTYEEAMRDYQRDRDTRALPIYEFTTQLGTLDPPPPEMQQLFAAIGGSQAAMDAFVSVAAGTLSPTEFFDPANLASILSHAEPG
jgi:flavin-dependent dehydrogenase